MPNSFMLSAAWSLRWGLGRVAHGLWLPLRAGLGACTGTSEPCRGLRHRHDLFLGRGRVDAAPADIALLRLRPDDGSGRRVFAATRAGRSASPAVIRLLAHLDEVATQLSKRHGTFCPPEIPSPERPFRVHEQRA